MAQQTEKFPSFLLIEGKSHVDMAYFCNKFDLDRERASQIVMTYALQRGQWASVQMLGDQAYLGWAAVVELLSEFPEENFPFIRLGDFLRTMVSNDLVEIGKANDLDQPLRREVERSQLRLVKGGAF